MGFLSFILITLKLMDRNSPYFSKEENIYGTPDISLILSYGAIWKQVKQLTIKLVKPNPFPRIELLLVTGEAYDYLPLGFLHRQVIKGLLC